MLYTALVLFTIFGLLIWILGTAPAPSARVDPVGIYLEDGYRSLIVLAVDTNISLWELGVGTPGMDGGDAIDITNMHNDEYRTMASRALKTLTEFTFTFHFDPAVYTQLESVINVDTTVTRHFPDGSTLAFYGFLRMVEFDEMTEGEVPTGTATITPTNRDPITRAEEGPVLASVAGT